MYKKSFKVNGQDDIDDFMLMVDATYYKYSEITRKDFFKDNIIKLLNEKDKKKLEFYVLKQSVDKINNLYFTDTFTVDIKILKIDYSSFIITTKHEFVNQNNQLCAITICSLTWD